MPSNLLSLLIFTPLVALLFLLLPNIPKKYYRVITLVAVIIQLLAALELYFSYIPDSEEQFQFVEKYQWINFSLGSFGSIAVDYFLGVDGLSVSLVLLAGIVLTIGAIASWNIEQKVKAYFALYLLLSSTIMGCFLALDFFLFYLFFEFMLLPMYFLIGLWGGPRREYASIKFFLYTLLGSLFILVAIIALYISVIDPAATAVNLGFANTLREVSPEAIVKVQTLLANKEIASDYLVRSFNMVNMQDLNNYIPGSALAKGTSGWTLFNTDPRMLAFLCLFIGFLVKLPAVPVHTWLPDAHVEAPTPISVVLAGILLKIGGYGILRTAYSIFPDAAIEYAWWIGLIGVVSIIYAAFNALAMKDLKKLIAYSSVSHMGFVLLGIASMTAEGLNGAVYMMFSHGILSSLLFLSTGVIYDRTHDRLIENYRGIATKMPKYTTIVTITFFASLGLPGFSGFISELLVLLGAFKSEGSNNLLSTWMAVAGAFGIVLGAAYLLWTLQKMFFGRFWAKNKAENLYDLTGRELLMMMPLVILTLIFGIFPDLLLDIISPSLSKFILYLNTK